MQEDEIRRLLTDAPEAGCRALFETYWAYAYAVVCRTLRSACGKEEIEECTADVLSDVMLHYDPARSGSLKAYIGTTARRRAIDRGKALSRRSTELSLDSETAPDIPSREDVAAAAEQAELSREVLSAVKALGEPDASIIIYKYYYDMNAAQIAKSLGMNPITVRSRCARAMKRLRAALSEYE